MGKRIIYFSAEKDFASAAKDSQSTKNKTKEGQRTYIADGIGAGFTAGLLFSLLFVPASYEQPPIEIENNPVKLEKFQQNEEAEARTLFLGLMAVSGVIGALGGYTAGRKKASSKRRNTPSP